MAINLDAHERMRFAAYLEERAKSDADMVIIMEKSGVVLAPMIKQLKAGAATKYIVANWLRSITEETIANG